MSLILDGSNGLSDVDGTAATPAIRGTDANTGIFFPAADTIAFSEGGTESMRLDSAGNVGIGTGSPASKLDVYNDANSLTAIRINNPNAGGSAASKLYFGNQFNASLASIGLVSSNANFDVRNDAGFPITFTIGSTQAAAIDGSSNFQFNSGYGSVATAYGCRAWVNFNGTGTVAIRASGNVSSITDNGTGNYTVNFTTAMPDANYSAVYGGQYSTTTIGLIVCETTATVRSTTALQIRTSNSVNTNAIDAPVVCVSIFR
jgi:hypothetical protein